MRPGRLFSALLLALAVSAPAAAVVSQPTAVSCLAGKCHRDISAQRYIHGPIGSGSCEICHQVSQWQQDKHPSLLTDASGKKCFFCHEEAAARAALKHQHTPVAKGECIACHEPHQSNNRFMLRDGDEGVVVRTAELCVTCHDISRRRAAAFHASVSLLDCITCHDPHASSSPYQLTHYVRTVYLRDHLAIGREELEAGNHREALDNLNLVLTVEPREISALTMAIQSHVALGQVEEARRLANRLLDVSPMSSEAHHLKGLVAMAAGQDFPALSSLQQSLSLRPDPAVLLALGRLQLKLGMQVDALASLNRASTMASSSAQVHRELAEIYQKLGRSDEAEKEKALLKELDR